MRGLAAGALLLLTVAIGSELAVAAAQLVAVGVVSPWWWCSYLVCWPLPAALLLWAAGPAARIGGGIVGVVVVIVGVIGIGGGGGDRSSSGGGGGDAVGGGGRERTGDVAHKRWPDVAANARDLISDLIYKCPSIFNGSVV